MTAVVDDLSRAVFPTPGIAPRRVREKLPATPRAPLLARCVVHDLCVRWQLDDELGERAKVVVTELVTNAVEHAGAGIELTVTVRRRALRLEVADGSAVLPGLSASPAGCGLRLVTRLASRCGSEPTPEGKIVWVELEIGPRFREETRR